MRALAARWHLYRTGSAARRPAHQSHGRYGAGGIAWSQLARPQHAASSTVQPGPTYLPRHSSARAARSRRQGGHRLQSGVCSSRRYDPRGRYARPHRRQPGALALPAHSPAVVSPELTWLPIMCIKADPLPMFRDVLVDFWAVWCGPCRMLAPTIDKIADQFAGKIKVGKLNTDEAQEIAIKYGISAIPQVLLFKGGEQPIDKQIGNQPMDNLVKMINRALEA